MKVAVAHTSDPDLTYALRELTGQLRAGIGDEPAVAALVFACFDMDHEALLVGLTEEFPGIQLIGCTTDGELTNILRFQEDSVVVTLFAGEGLQARAGLGRSISEDPQAALDAACDDALIEGETPRLLVTLPEGLSRCGADILVEGLNDRVPAGTPVVGGTAGDQWEFSSTHQFFGTEVLSDSLPLLAFYGAVRVSVGVSSGWAPIGHRGVVTEAEGAVVKSIDGLPALAFYQRYLGPHSETTPEYPIAVFVAGSETPFLRAPLSGDADTGEILFAGAVPVGASVQISEVITDDMLDACRRSVVSAVEGLEGRTPEGALVFSCAARKQLLGTRTASEVEILTAHIPEGLPVAGFYTYGEIAPQGGQVAADFHNETFVTVLLASEDAA